MMWQPSLLLLLLEIIQSSLPNYVLMMGMFTNVGRLQVSTWFANARRRLKKENKMTWEPKNKLDDEDVDVSDDEDKDNSFCRDEKSGKQTPSVTYKKPLKLFFLWPPRQNCKFSPSSSSSLFRAKPSSLLE